MATRARKTHPTKARPGAKGKLAPVVRDLDRGDVPDFLQVLQWIRASRARALAAANLQLVGLYWRIGQLVSQKVADAGWGRGTVQELSSWLADHEPGLMGFSASNLWRMRQFYDTYEGSEELAPLVRELPWTSNLLVLAKCKTHEEREFYVRVAVDQRWTKRELQRQIDGALFERAATGARSASKNLLAAHPDAAKAFKDSYLLEFLQLPDDHAESDLQSALVTNLKQFLLELGRDFCFVGEQYCVQVGTHDYFIDLLFFHRGLQALVAFELKIDDFKPAYMGQLDFYLEALDRDHRKPHEQPSIGVLLCKTRDREVVEYALSRTLSPALVAEYQTKLPDKALLQSKLDEFYDHLSRD